MAFEKSKFVTNFLVKITLFEQQRITTKQNNSCKLLSFSSDSCFKWYDVEKQNANNQGNISYSVLTIVVTCVNVKLIIPI